MDDLNKVAGVTSFNKGDRVSGLTMRGREDSRKTGKYDGTNGIGDIAYVIEDNGLRTGVWFDTLRSETTFKIGDVVSGTDNEWDNEKGRVTGTIKSIDGARAYLTLPDGRSWFVYVKSLRKEEAPAGLSVKVGDRVSGEDRYGRKRWGVIQAIGLTNTTIINHRTGGTVEVLTKTLEAAPAKPKVGERASAQTDVYDASSRVTGTLDSDDGYSAYIVEDNGTRRNVYSETLLPEEAPAFKIGDRVSGSAYSDPERDRKVGVIVSIGKRTPGIAQIDVEGGERGYEVYVASLRKEEVVFKVGDYVSGTDDSHDPEFGRVTGTIKALERHGDKEKFILVRDSEGWEGDEWWVWKKTVRHEKKAEATVSFKLGDRVSGTDHSDHEVDRVIGKLVDMGGGSRWWVLEREDNGRRWSVYPASVRPEPVAVVVEEATTEGDAAPETATGKPYDPELKTGKIDYNYVVVTEDDEPARFVTKLTGNSYPYLVIVTVYGEERPEQFDEDGDSYSGDYTLKNVFPAGLEPDPFADLPDVVYGRLLMDKSNDTLFFSEEDAFTSEEAARDAYFDDDSFVFVTAFPVTIPKKKHDQDDAEPDADDNDKYPPQKEAWINGYTYKVGDRVGFYKKHVGTRYGKVVKIRDHARSKILFQPDDGSTRYYALDKNIRR